MQNKKSLVKTKYAEYIRDFTALGNPFLLLLVTFCTLGTLPYAEALKISGILLLGFFASEFMCSGIKILWHKPRPNGQTFESALEKVDAGSFPSIHACRVSFVYGSLAYIQHDNYQYMLVCTFVIMMVGYSRVFLKKHFPSDVIAGYCFGSLTLFFSSFLY